MINKSITLCRSGLTIEEGVNLKSVLDNSALDDFVNTAILADKEVQVMRYLTRSLFVVLCMQRVHQNDSFLIEPTVNETMQTLR